MTAAAEYVGNVAQGHVGAECDLGEPADNSMSVEIFVASEHNPAVHQNR